MSSYKGQFEVQRQKEAIIQALIQAHKEGTPS